MSLLAAVGIGVVVSGCIWMYLHNGEIREVIAMGATMTLILVYLYFLEMNMLSRLIATGTGVILSGGTWMYFHNGKIGEAVVMGMTITLALFFLYVLHTLR